MDVFFEDGLKNLVFVLLPMMVEAEGIRDFMDIAAPRRFQKQRYYFIWYIVCVICLFAMECVTKLYPVEYGILIAFILVSLSVLYNTHTLRTLLITMGIIAVRVLFELIFSVRLLESLGMEVSMQDNIAVYAFFINMAPKTTLMLLLRAARGMVGCARIKGLQWKDFGLAMLVTFVFLRMFWLVFTECLHTGEVSSWNGYFLTGLLILNVSLFHLMNRLQSYYQNETELQEMNARMRIEMENIQAVKETHAKIRRISHGITNHLFAIETLLKNKQYAEAEKYLQKVNKTVEQDMLPIHTNNVVVDAILNQRYTLASSKNIKMHFDIQDLQICKLHETTLVSLLSHGLNNAIEACEKVKGDRIIELQIINEENELIISIENTVEQNVKIDHYPLPTTKRDKENHGIGLESIKSIVEQCKGQVFIESENNTFKLLIVFKFDNATIP